MNQILQQVLPAGGISASLAGGLFCGAAVIALFAMLAARLWRYRHAGSETFSLEDFSPVRYEPMARLLRGEDLKFLSAQPGYRPEIGARLQRDRRRIFRMYLRELAADFQALHAAARKMVAASPEQHSELVGSLVRQQATFWMAMAAVEVRLLIPRRANADVRELVESLIELVESMRLDLERLAAPAV